MKIPPKKFVQRKMPGKKFAQPLRQRNKISCIRASKVQIVLKKILAEVKCIKKFYTPLPLPGFLMVRPLVFVHELVVGARQLSLCSSVG